MFFFDAVKVMRGHKENHPLKEGYYIKVKKSCKKGRHSHKMLVFICSMAF